MSLNTKKRVFEILEKASHTDFTSRFIDVFIMSLIALNVTAVVLETVESLHVRFIHFFLYLEFFSILVFSMEYCLRIWSCTVNPEYGHPLWGRLRFMLTPMALIDLLAIAPFYFVFIHVDSRFLRALRLFRLFRVFKLGRYSRSFKTVGNVLRAKREELLINVFVVFILLVVASSLMYYVEHAVQPDVFTSIPAAMWWGVATLTTVGYGDVCPISPVGKLLGAVIALLGIGMFALPTGILASGFAEEVQKTREKQKRCPYCGQRTRKLHPLPSLTPPSQKAKAE